jgi:AcrR family transcriptional regulator
MIRGAFPLPPLDRLPSGRHRLERDQVEASQRGRLLLAVATAVADKGYGATTVADIVDRASVSRSTFYEQFPDKESCFLAAFDLGVDLLVGQVRTAAGALPSNADWRAHVRSDLTTYLAVLAAEPAFAWSVHVEVLAAGPAALEHRARIFELFTERTRRIYELARSQDRSLAELPREVFALHTGGMDELVRDRLRTRGAQALPDLAEPAIRATFALFGER